jgi:iron complex outermembrane receptor protein
VVRLVLGLAFVASIAAGAARAEDADQQVVAAPRQPLESRPLMPVSPTILDSSQLQTRGITSLEGIALATPAISLTPSLSSNNTPILYMRGQGLDNPTQITRDSAVGVFEDGFYVARPQALMFDVPDLDQVEVLRGPQGATYGRDTTGGVINLISKPPTGELHFTQSGDFGNRNLFRVRASVDTPRWHDVSARLTVLARSIDGDVINTNTAPSNDYGKERQRAGRLTLRWDGLSHLNADYFLEKSNLDSTPAYDTNPALNGKTIYSSLVPYFANPNGPTTTTYRPVVLPLSTSNHVAHGLTLTWQPMKDLAVKSLTGYRTLGADEKQDYAEFLGFVEATEDVYRYHQFSQELQLIGSLLDQQINLTGGVTYFREDGSHGRSYFAFTQGETIVNRVIAQTWSRAAYVQLHGQPAFFGRRLELTAAARITRDSKTAERFISNNVTGVQENGAAVGAFTRLNYNRVNPAFTLSYRWTYGISTYASTSTAYRAGGALETADVGKLPSSTFRPEGLTTYEVGLKAAFLDDHLRANIAAFSSRYRDIQYPISLNALVDQVYSLQQATIRGADLDLVATPLRDLTLSSSVAFLHWTIDNAYALAGTVFDPATGSGSPYVVGQNIKDLFSLQYAPKYNFMLGADYAFLHLDGGDVSAHLDYAYRGTMFSDPGSGLAVPGHQFDTLPAVGLLNARLAFAHETDWNHHVNISLWGRNVLNRKYYQVAGGYGSGGYGSGLSAFTNGAIPGYSARAGAWAEPATYGISVSYRY